MKVKYKLITTIAMYLIGVFGLIFLVINPLQSANESLVQNILQTRENFTQQQKEIQTILKNNKTFKGVDTTKVNYMFLDSQNALYLIDTLEKLAEVNNCDIEIELSEPNGEENHFQELNLTLNVNGELNNVMNFLNNIEQENFYINYKNIGIAPISSENIINSVAINITATTYWK